MAPSPSLPGLTAVPLPNIAKAAKAAKHPLRVSHGNLISSSQPVWQGLVSSDKNEAVKG